MSIKLDGFDDLVADLERLGNVGVKVGKQAIKEGAEIVLSAQKQDSPKDVGDASKKLKITRLKGYKTGSAVAYIGLSSDDFEDYGYIYYQNYSFEHYKNGERVAVHLDWIGSSLKSVEEEVSKKIIDTVSREIDNIL